MFQFLRGESSPIALRLGETALFSGLTASELKTLEAVTHVRHYQAGEIVFDAGEEGQALYVIVTGKVVICHPGQVDRPIAVLGEGSFFGELALLDNGPRSAQARAGADSQLAVFFRGDFERLMDSHARIASRIAIQLARSLGQRLRTSVAQSAMNL